VSTNDDVVGGGVTKAFKADTGHIDNTSKYIRPDDLPGRVCRVLEGYTLLEMRSKKESLEDMVYRFTHIASGKCGNPHEDWMEDFLELEAIVEEAAYTSPAELERRRNEAKTEGQAAGQTAQADAPKPA